MGYDYGMGTTNIDQKTRIRFGVIPARDLGEWWHEEAEMVYGCQECDEECLDGYEDSNKEHCGDGTHHPIGEDCYCEPIAIKYDADGYFATQSAGSYASSDDIFVEKSPYVTRGPFCSPCAPGAVYLRDGSMDGEAMAYCFGPDCFSEENPCPYPVWKYEDLGALGARAKLIYKPNDKRYTAHKRCW